MLENEDLAPLIDQQALAEFRQRALSPEHPVARGMAENPDTFFAHRESCNSYYDAVPAIVEEYMDKISEITGRKYGLFNYYGVDDAERVIILMGSATEAAREAIDYLIAKPRMRTYIEYSANIYAIYLKYIDKNDIHVYSIDECFIDYTKVKKHNKNLNIISDACYKLYE